MRRHLPVGFFILSSALLVATLQARVAERPFLTVVTDRPAALYAVGENAKFLITLKKDGQPLTEGEISYVLDNDGVPPAAKGKLKLDRQPAAIEATLAEPGFCVAPCRTPLGGRSRCRPSPGRASILRRSVPACPCPKISMPSGRPKRPDWLRYP